MTTDLLPELRKHPFVAEFRPEHTKTLAALAKQEHFDAGQVISREGDAHSVFYLLGEGMVALDLEVPSHVLRAQTLTPETNSTGRRCCARRANMSRRARCFR